MAKIERVEDIQHSRKLRGRNWTALFTTNFMGVFNDNFLKNLIVYVAMVWTLPSWLTQSQLVSVLSAAMVLPYILLSPYAGELSRLQSKLKIFRFFKWTEIPIMLLACFGLYFHDIYTSVLAVTFMGIQSCLYSPAKYGLIRDIGGEEKASWGSGLFETITFLAILMATIISATLSDHYNVYMAMGIFLLVAVIGVVMSYLIKVKELPNETKRGNRNPLHFLRSSFLFAKDFPMLNQAVFGAAWLWFLGSLIQMNTIIHAIHTLGYSNSVSGYYMGIIAIGIGLGTSVTGYIAGQGFRRDLMTLGLVGMALSCFVVAVLNPTGFVLGFVILAMTFFAGMFTVPCLSYLQQVEIGRRLSDMTAYMNLMAFILMFFGSLLFSRVMSSTGENTRLMFLIIGLLALLGIWLVPFPAFFKKGWHALRDRCVHND